MVDNNVTFELPINSLSFGQVSVCILREAYERGINPCILPIGPIDISAQKVDEDFKYWLQSALNKFNKYHKRSNRTFKLWHTNGSMSACAEKQTLFTFHETNWLTDSEINILSQQDRVFVSSNYTKKIFNSFGLNNVYYTPLGFDRWNFKEEDHLAYDSNVTTFLLSGKMEKRKSTLRTLNLWARKYGNNINYRLHCLINNPFINQPNLQAQIVAAALNNTKYWNIIFLEQLKTNAEVNQYLNSGNIDLTGLSFCEGFNLMPFHSLCLGKNAIFLNAHVHQDYANKENSILVEPSGMQKAVDDMFFHEGQEFNQGFWFDWRDEDVLNAMEQAEKLGAKKNPNGAKLKEFNAYGSMLDTFLNS